MGLGVRATVRQLQRKPPVFLGYTDLMATIAAAKDNDEVTATSPTPKAALGGEATPERRSAPEAPASPRGGTPGAAHSPVTSSETGHAGVRAPATSCATGHAGAAGAPQQCRECALGMVTGRLRDRVSILKERAWEETSAEESCLHEELQEHKAAHGAGQAGRRDLEEAVQQNLILNDELRASERLLKTELVGVGRENGRWRSA